MSSICCVLASVYLGAVSAANSDSEMAELDSVYECRAAGISEYFEDHLVVFDSFEGTGQFMKERLPTWAYSLVSQAAKHSITQYLDHGGDMDSLYSVRAQFLEILRQGMVKRLKSVSEKKSDCEYEVAALIDSLSQSKIYNLYNDNFHRALMENNLSLRVSATDNYIDVFILSFLPNLKHEQAVCEFHEQKGARAPLKFYICN